MVKTSEILELLKAQKFEEIKSKLESIDEPVNSNGYTILMYATSYRDEDAIKFFLKHGASPFKEDQFGTSAFSIAFHQEMEDVAKDFVFNKVGSDFKELHKTYHDLAEALNNDTKGKFAYYVASHICTEDPSLRDFLELDVDGGRRCFSASKSLYENLGEDGTDLLGTYEVH